MSFTFVHVHVWHLMDVFRSNAYFCSFLPASTSLKHKSLTLHAAIVCIYCKTLIPVYSFPDLQRIEQNERVSMGIDGNLYFSNALQNDSRQDYCCFASFPRLRTIVQKTAMAVVVKNCRSTKEFVWLKLKYCQLYFCTQVV